MKDRRAWAPVDIGYLDNPKMAKVLAASSTATLMHLASILYCAQHLTDGHISPGVARMRAGGSREDEALLTSSGLWHLPGHDCDSCPEPNEGDVYVHNFLEHNRTAAEVKAVSEKRSKVAREGWKRRKQDAPSNAKSMQVAEQIAMQDEAVCNAERDRERDKENPHSPSALEGFDEFWSTYPKKVAKKAAQKVWQRAVKDSSPEEIINGAQRYAEQVKREKTERTYIKSPDGWLNAGRWEDEITPAPTTSKNPLWDT